ncbi:glyoxalase [Streptomyces sp. V2]|uniref:VOC family protein n=1 Tax=Streptomyces niveiscabiei TaxID=164115 RepID=A0ABW9HHS8_9ACTN|nr:MULTISPECIES: VOC family protein [unclassified Streptomyces]PWG07206.1 glyoxalase [Streptomyces sp. V2]QZZ28189.1 glyoxalase [Streptomyces sp. ST1015]
MSPSITFIVYVSHAPTAARFYADLLDLTPTFETPGYIAFALGDKASLSLWSSHTDTPTPETPRTSEVCLTVPDGPDAIDHLFKTWTSKGARPVTEPMDAVFGRTFVVADPDGNLIRVAPTDA